MISRQNWSKMFRLMLIVDSVVFLLKLAIVAWLIAGLVQEKIRWNGRPEFSDSDVLHDLIYIPWYCGIISLIILVILRWLNNTKQYRNENRTLDANSSEKLGWCFCFKCCRNSRCWFFFGFLNIASVVIILSIDWCRFTQNLDLYWTCEYPRNVAITLLLWETIMFFFIFRRKRD